MEEYTLYRTYSKDGTLLYIGQSNSWPRRFMEHRTKSPWFQDAVKVEIQSYLNKQGLDEAERQAVKKERPAHNVVYNNGNQSIETIARHKRRNSVSPGEYWLQHEPFGSNNCYKCGRQDARLDESWMSIAEMVTEIEKHGDIRDGVAPYCAQCYCGYEEHYLSQEYDLYQAEQDGPNPIRNSYAIDAARSHRCMEFIANGVKSLDDAITVAECFVEYRKEARTKKIIEVRHNEMVDSYRNGKKTHQEPRALWPQMVPYDRPEEICGMIFGRYHNGSSAHAQYLDSTGNRYRWDGKSLFAKQQWYGQGSVEKPLEKIKTYKGFIGTVLRIEGHK